MERPSNVIRGQRFRMKSWKEKTRKYGEKYLAGCYVTFLEDAGSKKVGIFITDDTHALNTKMETNYSNQSVSLIVPAKCIHWRYLEPIPTGKEYTPIELLHLSPRTINALINGGVGSREQLNKKTTEDLLKLRGFSEEMLDEVLEAMGLYGWGALKPLFS